MLLAGWDIRKWIQVALSLLEDNEAIPVAAPATQADDLPEHCSICGKSVHEYEEEDFYYSANGKLYCAEHYAQYRSLDALFGDEVGAC